MLEEQRLLPRDSDTALGDHTSWLFICIAELALVQAEKALLEESCHGKEPRGLLAGLRRRKRTLSWRAPHVEAPIPTLTDGEGTPRAIHPSGKLTPRCEKRMNLSRASPLPLPGYTGDDAIQCLLLLLCRQPYFAALGAAVGTWARPEHLHRDPHHQLGVRVLLGRGGAGVRILDQKWPNNGSQAI